MPRFPRSTGLLRPLSHPRRGPSLDAAVYRHLLELQTDDPIVGFSDDPLQRIHRPELYPLISSAAQGGGRASLVSDPPVRAAKDEHLHKLLEDHLVGDTSAVAAERMIHVAFGQQGGKLLPDGLLFDVSWHGGHGDAPSHRRASRTPRMMDHPCPFTFGYATYWRKL